jgi:hypothetical protein
MSTYIHLYTYMYMYVFKQGGDSRQAWWGDHSGYSGHVYLYIYLSTYVCMYINIYMYIYIYKHIYIYICILTYTFIFLHSNICISGGDSRQAWWGDHSGFSGRGLRPRCPRM